MLRPASKPLASLDRRPARAVVPTPVPSPAMKRSLLAILTVLLVLGAPGSASAAGLTDDCQDGKIDGTYSQAQYRQALQDIATDLDEYSDCRAVIRRAQLAAARRGSGGGGQATGSAGTGGGGGTGAGGGGTGAGGSGADASNTVRPDPLQGATSDERRALKDATAGGDAPVTVAGVPIRPGSGLGDVTHDVPGPLLALLVLLGVAAAGGAAWLIRSRVSARRAG